MVLSAQLMIRAKKKQRILLRVKVPKFNVFLIKKINTVFFENIAFLVFFLTKNKYVDFIVKKFFFIFRKRHFQRLLRLFF